MEGTTAEFTSDKGSTFYNFGSTAPYPPAATPPAPEPVCVDFGIDWEPAAFDLDQYVAFFLGADYPSLNGATDLSFEATIYRELAPYDVWLITGCPTLETISFPNATEIDAFFYFFSLPALTTVSFPALVSQTDNNNTLRFDNNTALTSIDFPVLVNSSGLRITGSTSLTSISIPVLVPKNGRDFNFSGNALDATTVNALLARCVANAAYVSGTVTLSGGTNAAPSGQGIIDKATLIGRGVAVNTN
jgi:hypothetical protein